MTASNLSDRFLFGRSQVLRQVVGSKVGLTLLVGDSGIGKSEILGHAQTTTETMLAPPPVEVFSRDGAIVEAVCESLALALAFAATEPGHEAQLRLVREYIQELAKRSGSFVAQVAKEALLHQLTLRLGDRVVELGKNLAAEIVKSGDGLLAARVGDFRSADVMSELASLASEVRDLSGREVLSIAVDRLEILPEADVRLLADVAPRLPEGIVIKAALLDTTSAGAAALQLVRQVAGDAVAVISVEPLGELTVREILEASELDPAAAPDVLRLTGGYPLHIGDLVRHIATGGQVNRATTNDDFGQLIKARWDGLPLECRQVARQLCVLERPLPTDSLIATLGIQVAAWWDIVETLRTERILTQTVDGLPWFHEQRRRWLVDRLPDEERRATASRMLPAVCEVALGASGWRYCTTLSALIEAAGDLIHDPALYQVSMLTESELAIAGAALELGAQARPVDAALLLTHARRTFRAGHDLVAALESLENRGWLLIDRVSEFHIADVRAAIGPLEEVAIGGRCQDRLARLPVVDLARAVWETSLGMVAPTLHLALLGVGWPIPGREIEQVHIAKMRSTRRLGPFHGCLVIGDLEGVPIYAAASTEADQVGALEEAWSGATGEIGGCTFSVRTIFSVPSSRLRGRRWSVVADDLVGCHVTRSDEAGHQMSLRSQLEMTVALRDAIRDATLLAERAVAGVEEQVHIHYQMKGSETTIVDVLGQEPGVTQVNCLDPWWIGDSLVALRFAEQLSLPSEFRVGKMVTGSWHSDLHPIRAIARDIENDIQSFNKHHPRVQVDAQQGSLERWLLPLMERRYQDAMQLYERLKTSDLERPSRCEVFLLGVESLVFSLPGINATLATRPSLTSSVHYRLKNRPSGGTNRIALNEEFPNSTGLPISSGSLAWVLARLSGYSEDDLQVHP